MRPSFTAVHSPPTKALLLPSGGCHGRELHCRWRGLYHERELHRGCGLLRRRVAHASLVRPCQSVYQ